MGAKQARLLRKQEAKLRQDLSRAGIPTTVEGLHLSNDEEFLLNTFNPQYPYSYCRICGWVFQSPTQRWPVPLRQQLYKGQTNINGVVLNKNAPNDSLKKQIQRRNACQRHDRKHTDIERKAVQDGGMTAEAIFKLAAFGITDLLGMAMSQEKNQAGNEAPRISEEVDQSTYEDGATKSQIAVPNKELIDKLERNELL